MSQSLSNVLLHIIFSTKNRQPFIDSRLEPELHAYLTTICASHGSYVHKIGGLEDHIHLLVTLPRTLTISNLLEELKKNSSKWIKAKGANYQEFLWQKGFGAFSVSMSQCPAVSTYISNQKEHHKNQSYQDEFRQFLQLHQIPFDEKYVWD